MYIKNRFLRISVYLVFIISTVLLTTAYAFGQTEELDILDGKPAANYSIEIQNTLPSEIPAKFWAISDADGNILYSRGADVPVKIASMTKIMTALVAIDFPLETEIMVSEYAASIPGSSADIMAGDITTLSEMLKGLMLPSGNDAAYAIAFVIGSKILIDEGNIELANDELACIDRFVAQMNAKASELGLRDTLFVNPCGLDDYEYEGDHHSTAADVIIQTRHLMENEYLANIVDMPKAVMTVSRDGQKTDIELENTNTLLKVRPDEAIGTKTGFTDAAGSCFAGSCVIGQDHYYSVVLNCEGRAHAMFATAALWDWIRNAGNVIDYTSELPQSGSEFIVAELSVPQWLNVTVPVGFEEAIDIPKWYWEPDLTYDIEIGEIEEGFEKHDKIGSFSVIDINGNKIESRDIEILSDIPHQSLWDKIYTFFARLISPLTNEKTVADSVEHNSEPVFSGRLYPEQPVPITSPVDEPVEEVADNIVNMSMDNVAENPDGLDQQLPDAA